MSSLSPITFWDCGCKTFKAGETFFIRPCKKTDCKVYPIVIEESKKRGNRIEVEDI